MAGYSGTPLLHKLGYQADDTVYAQFAPSWFRHELMSEGVQIVDILPARWAHVFFENQAALKDFLKTNDLNKIEKALWVSWPKKSSGIETDLTEQTFRDLILPTGWVDIKVAAIDDTWSGLKFTRRIT